MKINQKGGIIAFAGGNIVFMMVLALLAVAGLGPVILQTINFTGPLSIIFIIIFEAGIFLVPE